jgi:alkanesulfonate monooxygenase SsuD/methylene tetrahydromethanopterin reductase-like flavin-dependent oxidoreductase (luciferase family)
MTDLLLRFDMRNPDFGASSRALYDAAIEMSVWAEEHGFYGVQLSEHHASEDGYLASPIVLAAAIAARTRRIRLRFALLLLPINNPLRIAEDLAILDIISGGRIEVVLGAGYVREEFEMFGIEPRERPRLMEEGFAAIRAAWTGEAFSYRGRRALVRPRPLQQPHPPLWMGGTSPAAARRAAGLADYFFTENPELFAHFNARRQELGMESLPFRDIGTGFLAASPDPDREWARLAPYILHECNSYGRWMSDAATTGQYREISDATALRESGVYPVLTADDCVEYIRARGDNGQVCLHPLISGLPPEIGWEQLQFFAERVLPRLHT